MAVLVEKCFRWLLLVSLLFWLVLSFFKDRLPDASFYDSALLGEPIQTRTLETDFPVNAGGEAYRISPRFDYQLEGVIVSEHDTQGFFDVVHHKFWRDFINLRDLCVIWGDNVESGVYRDLEFKNGTFTCWVTWSSREERERFDPTQLSNNHLLIDDEAVKNILMRAAPGDQVRLQGMLVEYTNLTSGGYRGTSTRRDDIGNGACETIYVENFEIVKRANPKTRLAYSIAGWTTLFALAGVTIMFIVAPHRGRYS